MLALVWATQYFKPYLYGHPFQARSDHRCLKWLRTFKEPKGQVARWIEMLQEYDFYVLHILGQIHSNADALSRKPCKQCGIYIAHSAAIMGTLATSVENTWLPNWTRVMKNFSTNNKMILTSPRF